MQNSFDIVIPTFNRAHSIDCAINSVLNQTYTKWNLFILDNCSTDDTQEVVSKYLSNSKISTINFFISFKTSSPMRTYLR